MRVTFPFFAGQTRPLLATSSLPSSFLLTFFSPSLVLILLLSCLQGQEDFGEATALSLSRRALRILSENSFIR